ncbi:M4 family metallopeptidase [Streptomyces sp. NPDC047976]|uniref:M4 family metallopeptidase n=1 Tax=Streptomyces sp. NPDC047976 TaxID=3155746 RepID=UPI00342DAC32
MSRTRPINCIIPPYLLEKLMESGDSEVRQAALDTLLTTARLRGERSLRRGLAELAAAPGDARRTIFDCEQSEDLSDAVMARSENGPESPDEVVNQAFEALGLTRDFYKEAFQRDSIDDRGMRLNAFVHFGRRVNNAFWDGSEMLFGDGDGVVLGNLAGSLTVAGHELTHGVVDHTSRFEYHNQSGALNESMADVFGSLVKQWSLKQTVEEADWLVGAEVWTPGIEGDALRSMKAPGTAYDNPLVGKDPQPDRMSRFVHLPDTPRGDNGGVHFNSGIPNKAFYATAVGIGGFAWEFTGRIWYEAMRASGPRDKFQDFADMTFQQAGRLFGVGSSEQAAVVAGWHEVEIQITGVPPGLTQPRSFAVNGHGGAGREADLAALTRQIAALSDKVTGLAKEMAALKVKGSR